MDLQFFDAPTSVIDKVAFTEPDPVEGAWYRYEDRRSSYAGAPSTVTLRVLRVVRTTPRGVILDDWGTERFVRNDARKRFACPTIELARASFLKRKQWQMGYAREHFDHVAAVLAAVEKRFA